MTVVSFNNRKADEIYRCLADADIEDLAGDQPLAFFIRGHLVEMLSGGEFDMGALSFAPIVGADGREIARGLDRAFARYDRVGYPPLSQLTASFANQLGFAPDRDTAFMAARSMAEEVERRADADLHDQGCRTLVQAMVLHSLDSEAWYGRSSEDDTAALNSAFLLASVGQALESGVGSSRFVNAHISHYVADPMVPDAAETLLTESDPSKLQALRRRLEGSEAPSGAMDSCSRDNSLNIQRGPWLSAAAKLADARLLTQAGLTDDCLLRYDGRTGTSVRAGSAPVLERVHDAGGFASTPGKLFELNMRVLYARHLAGSYIPNPNGIQPDHRQLVRRIEAEKTFASADTDRNGGRYIYWLDGSRTEIHRNGAMLNLDPEKRLADPVSTSASKADTVPAVVDPSGNRRFVSAREDDSFCMQLEASYSP